MTIEKFVKRAIKVENILKGVLISEGCWHSCKHSCYEKGFGYSCDESDDDGRCKNHDMFEIDFQKVINNYDLKEGDIP